MKKNLLVFPALFLSLLSYANNENYSNQDVSRQDFSNRSLKNSYWVRANATGTNFQNSDLTNANFYSATLTNADLSNADLTRASFTWSTLTNTDFTDATITGADFKDAKGFTKDQLYSTASYKNKDLRGIGLMGCNLTGWGFSGHHLMNCNLSYADLSKADLSNANLSSVDFTNANLSSANLTSSNLSSATLTDADVSGANLTGVKGFTFAQLFTTWNYKNKNLSGLNLSGFDLSGKDLRGFNLSNANLSSVNFTNANLSSANLTSSNLSSATLTDADVSGANFTTTKNFTKEQLYSTKSYKNFDLQFVSFKNLNLTSWNFAGQNLADASFESANLSGANFLNANIAGAVFAKSTNFTTAQLYQTKSYKDKNLADTDFSSLDLTNADFSSQNLSNANFTSANLKNANFTNANIENAVFDNASNFTASQLYTTATYKTGNLNTLEIFEGATLSSWNLSGKNLGGVSFVNSALNNANLSKANLSDTNFTSANLTSADLSGATLTNADLSSATLTSAKLNGASLKNAVLSNAVLNKANISKANLGEASMSKANFTSADLSGSDLSKANLSNATLTSANLSGANLASANLSSANLSGANLDDAEILSANFASAANFTSSQLYSTKSYQNANLSGVNFSSLNLSGWDFQDMNLNGATFNSANLTNCDFRNTKNFVLPSNATTKNTILADGTIKNFSISSSAPVEINAAAVHAKFAANANVSSRSNLVLNEGAQLDITSNSTLTIDDTSSLTMNLSDTDNTAINVESGSSLVFKNGAKLYLNIDRPASSDISYNIIKLKNGATLEGFELMNLSGYIALTNCSVAYESFTCERVGNNVVLRVAKEVKITAQPKNQDLCVGENYSFSVSAAKIGSAPGNLSYSWYVDKNDGKGFVKYNKTTSSFSGSATLSMNGWKFYCQITNGRDAVASNIVSISVESSPIRISSEPSTSLEVSENAKYDLKVSATERSGKALSFSWFVDKKDNKGFVKAGSGAKIVITPKANMLGWQYYCEVSNGSETRKTSVSTIVAVKAPAKIVGKIAAVEAFEGVANRGFTVSATGDNLSYQWEISRDKGKTWQQISGATSSTYIPESDPELNGAMYRCRVYNEGSSVYSASAKFTVREAPKVEEVEVFQSKIQLPFDGSTVVAYEDYPIDLKATAKGYKIKYQWYKNGIAIKGATKATFSIKKPLESQDSYFCAVFNGNVVAQSSEFVLDIRPCPLPADFAARSVAITGESELFGDMNLSLLFTAKTALKLACAEYAVSNPSWSFKRTSPTSGKVTLKFKLYTDDEPISKLNTRSLAYTGTLEFDEADGIYYLDLFDKKLGEFNATFTDADMEVSVKTALQTLPQNKNIIIGGEVVRLLDKKNFSSGEIRGTYTYKWNKNGTGLLKLTWSVGKDKFTKEVSLLALTAKSGIAIVSTSWNEAKSKFMDSECVDFEIK